MQITDFNSFQQFINEEDVRARFGISRIGVFGSLARGEKNIRDIDLLIDDDQPDFVKLLHFKNYLEMKLGTQVDIVIKKYADPVILFRAMKDIKYATIH